MAKNSVSRRSFIAMGAAAALLPGAAFAHPLYGGDDTAPTFTRDPNLLPPPSADQDFPIATYAQNLPPQFRMQQVTIGVQNPAGAIVIDPDNRFLYYMLGGDQAIRYGVGVGREGFAWSGDAYIGMKRKWPRWVPPESMVQRDPNARKWANGMPGGPDNPLGARAMYLFANGQDTQYRIHGTNEPSSIGHAMSSGCIRMLNEYVADLFDRTTVGTHVRVLASQQNTASFFQ